jgi:hypothetical protein
MNGLNGGASLWQEATNADGRVYYYNTQTKVTQWAKPAELLTPAEVRFHDCFFPLCFANPISVPCLINHGRNILQKVGGSIGIIQKPNKAHGRCQKPTKMLSIQLLLYLQNLHPRKCDLNYHLSFTNV